jgi:hypothetical protein
MSQGYGKLNVRQGHYTPIASGSAPEARGIEGKGCEQCTALSLRRLTFPFRLRSLWGDQLG